MSASVSPGNDGTVEGKNILPLAGQSSDPSVSAERVSPQRQSVPLSPRRTQSGSPKHHAQGLSEERDTKRQRLMTPHLPNASDSRQDDAEGEAELDSDVEMTDVRGSQGGRLDTPSSRPGTPTDRKEKKSAPVPGKRIRKPKSELSKEKDRIRKKMKRDEERAAKLAAAEAASGTVSSSRPKEVKEVKEAKEVKEEPGQSGEDGDYCICNGENDEDGGTMVGCEMCDNWFHPVCVGLNEAQVDMLDAYICAACEEKTGRESVYRKRCKRDECKEAVRPTSKFCSSQCAFAHSQSLLQGLDKKDVQELRALEAYPSPSPSVNVERDAASMAPAPVSSSTSSLLQKLSAQADQASKALDIVRKRQAVLVQAVDAWEALAPSAPVADDKKKNKNKRRDAPADTRPCGWDPRLLWDDETLSAWDGQAPATADEEGETANARAESLGLCTGGRRCERHAGWQKTTSVALDVEAAQLARRRDEITQMSERVGRANETEAVGKAAQDSVQTLLKAR